MKTRAQSWVGGDRERVFERTCEPLERFQYNISSLAHVAVASAAQEELQQCY